MSHVYRLLVEQHVGLVDVQVVAVVLGVLVDQNALLPLMQAPGVSNTALLLIPGDGNTTYLTCFTLHYAYHVLWH